MTRILADLPDEDIRWLDQIAAEQGRSRASILRDAVTAYRADVPGDWLEFGFGAWTRHGISLDLRGHARQRRAEWTRPWDNDYEEVRADSPERFTAEDDRERAHYLALAKKGAGKRQPPRA